jgi:EAL domain-containing protein (putative c-di-GMP-specific phosphodiesterase class I)
MRVWEFEDSQALTDLVREQDFILRVRRLLRVGTPHLVVNLVLNALDVISKSARAMEAVQERLQEFAKVTRGAYSEMSNGDAFIIWEETHETQILASKIIDAILPDGHGLEDTSQLMLTYHMPQDYVALRERANHYVETVRAAAALGAEAAPSQALKSDAVRGPLTAWSVDQIGRLLTDIDLRRYGRTQPIYHYEADGGWKSVSEEYFISIEDLRRERFPKLQIITPEHLFLALCETLDQRLLSTLTEHYNTISERPIHMNLAVATVVGATFAQFTHIVPQNKRSLICFEIHRGDLLQDFTLTLNAIDVLKSEGFKVAIDGVTPDMVNYVNFNEFKVDFIKINVSKDRAAQLADPVIRKALARLPADKLIFFRCDNEKALAAGLELGVSKFQGWLIDDAVLKRP